MKTSTSNSSMKDGWTTDNPEHNTFRDTKFFKYVCQLFMRVVIAEELIGSEMIPNFLQMDDLHNPLLKMWRKTTKSEI